MEIILSKIFQVLKKKYIYIFFLLFINIQLIYKKIKHDIGLCNNDCTD